MDILVVDLARVLDETVRGQRASAELKSDFTAAREKLEALRAQAKSATGALQKTATEELQKFERASLTALDEKKVALREQLLNDVRGIVDDLRKQAGASFVLDASAVVLAPKESDITEQVIAQLDARAR